MKKIATNRNGSGPLDVRIVSDEDAFAQARAALCRIFAKAEKGEASNHDAVDAARIIYAHAARAEGSSGISTESYDEFIARRVARR